MKLKEVLENLVNDNKPVLLVAGSDEYEAGILLSDLEERKLNRNVYVNDYYIAEMKDDGYLGSLLYKFKARVHS